MALPTNSVEVALFRLATGTASYWAGEAALLRRGDRDIGQGFMTTVGRTTIQVTEKWQ